jgi:hypothetical protein
MEFLTNNKNGHKIGIHVESGLVNFYCSDSKTKTKICVQCADLMLVALVDSGGIK